ncbi:MAG: hypothetical protein WB765_05775, partial [Acidimicrobiales bacterium]
GYPRRSFVAATAVAGVVWATYAFFLGRLGGEAFKDRPWFGLLLALGIALAVTAAVEGGRRSSGGGDVASTVPPTRSWPDRSAPPKNPVGRPAPTELLGAPRNVSVGCREPAGGSVPAVNTATMGRTTRRRT